MPQSSLAVGWLEEGSGYPEGGADARRTARGAPRPTDRDIGVREERGERSQAEEGVPGRRTITITGRGAVDRLHPPPQRRRPARRPHERPGFRPDRAAMWAVLLCVLMILAAATSSHASTPPLRSAGSGGHGGALTTLAAVSTRR